MRNPERLDEFYEHLLSVYKNNFPDWRFGQFICNLEHWYGKDIFYTEDSAFCNIVTMFVEEHNRKVKNESN